eukprot:2250650-Pleurochrysis_carterae.AAC.3
MKSVLSKVARPATLTLLPKSYYSLVRTCEMTPQMTRSDPNPAAIAQSPYMLGVKGQLSGTKDAYEATARP